MNRDWLNVDLHLSGLFARHDAALDEALRASTAAGLPEIAVAPNQGKLLHLLARMVGARRILEIGTLGGYSAIWLARALPAGGQLVTLEYREEHAAVARTNLARAGLAERTEVRVGAALDLLPVLEAEGAEPFDFVFIDADKPNNVAYVEWAVRLARAGAAIVLDNVVRDGKILDPDSTDPAVVGTRDALALMARHPRLDATALQTVGAKDWDGFALAIVTG